MAEVQETRELEPILFYREHCGKPLIWGDTAADIIADVFVKELAWTEWTGTATRCDLRCFIDFKDSFTPASTVVENESDRCGEWVKCRKCIKEQGITFTLLDCKDDTTFANRLGFMGIVAGIDYMLDTATNSYVRANAVDSRECKFIDIMKFQCDPVTMEYYDIQIFYRLSIAEGTEIVNDCSKFARTQEFVNTEIALTMPRGGCSYEQRINTTTIQEFIDTYCNKTPQALLDQESTTPAALKTWSTEKTGTEINEIKATEAKVKKAWETPKK